MSVETRLVTPRAGLRRAPAEASGLARGAAGTRGAGGTSARRRLLAGAGAVAGALALPGRAWAQAAPGAAAPAGTAALAADAVYFEETGHTVSGEFWRFWRTHGLDAFGFPIGEPYEDGGVRNQWFQRARFELPPGGGVRLGLLGIEAGGAQPPAPGTVAPPANSPDVRLIPETGHTVQGAFLPAFTRWRTVLGLPVGPEQAVPGGYIQYFANGRLEWDPFGGTRLGLVGSELAFRRGLDTRAVARPAGSVTWGNYVTALIADENDRRAFGTRITGTAGFVPRADERWVLVSIGQQRVTAYEGTKSVFNDACSTGAAYKGLSSKGIFAIDRRVPNEVMDSTTIGYPRGHEKYYRLENVLYTQYYNGGEALHYAWWHDNFGQPMSFGCINLRLNTAKWMWDFASLGTRVVVA